MNPSQHFPMPVKVLSLAVLSVTLAGCNQNSAKVYSVPKETAAAPATAADSALPPGHPDTSGMGMGSGMNMGMPSASRPKLTYKTPEGWTESDPGSMRVASFKISKDGKQADVSVIPLGGGAGGDVANVNRWRGQVGLEPAAEDDLKKAAQPVEVAGQPAELYDLDGKNPGNGEPMRVLGVIQHRDEIAWFFKVSGDSEFVEAQKPALIEFLKSVKYEAPEAAAMPAGHPPMGSMAMPGMAAASAPISHEGQPAWSVPAGWQETGGGQFLIAKFLITGEGNAMAAVNVSASAGTGGGLGPNVNRWRNQLGLATQSEEDIAKSASSMDVAGGKATIVEMTGTDSRTGQPAKLVGAMVPQAEQTWFYKLMGDAKVVDAQKDAFTKFLQTVKY
ncbi:MAG TPA: hypothetical protein VK327_08430 [Candidatus Paceibacterota bacterium]|nr:hypothetical protein [Candidatus Paceibacterota bacterium]